jgi:hypothetical protein
MSLPIARLLSAAETRGLSQSSSVLLTVDGGVTDQRVNVIVSYDEPVSVIAPLDLLWIEPISGQALRRVSRANSNAYTHTWTEASETSFWLPQIWDEPTPNDQQLQELERNIGNPHLLITDDIDALNVINGGTVIGPLQVRVGTTIDEYTDAETLPKILVKKLTDAAQAVAASVYQQLASFRSQLTALRSRVTAVEKTVVTHTTQFEETEVTLVGHERRIKRLEDSDPNIPTDPTDPVEGLPSKRYIQYEAADEWLIEHGMATSAVIASVYLQSGEMVMPDVMESVDDNTFRVTFAKARAGTAVLVGIR